MRNMIDREPPVSEMAGAVDVLCCNRREWEALDDREEVAARISILVVTDGASGSQARYTDPQGDARTIRQPAFPRDRPPRDTNRAGEAFAATLTATLIGLDWDSASGVIDDDAMATAMRPSVGRLGPGPRSHRLRIPDRIRDRRRDGPWAGRVTASSRPRWPDSVVAGYNSRTMPEARSRRSLERAGRFVAYRLEGPPHESQEPPLRFRRPHSRPDRLDAASSACTEARAAISARRGRPSRPSARDRFQARAREPDGLWQGLAAGRVAPPLHFRVRQADAV